MNRSSYFAASLAAIFGTGVQPAADYHDQPRGWWDRPAAGLCRGMDKPSRSHYRPGSHPERELPCRVTKAARRAKAAAYKLVRAKRVTWMQLEKAGKCTVAKHSGRQPGASIVWLLDLKGGSN